VLRIPFGEVALADRPGAIAAIGRSVAFRVTLEAGKVLVVGKSPGGPLILGGVIAGSFGGFSCFEVTDGVVSACAGITQQASVDGWFGSQCAGGEEQGCGNRASNAMFATCPN